MNETWIDELRTEPIDTDPRLGFKNELRTALIAEQRSDTTSPRSASSGRRSWLIGAAAACVALLIGALFVFAGDDRTLTPSTVPESTTPTPATMPSTDTEPPTDTEPANSTVADDSLPVTSAVPDVIVTDTQTIGLDQWIEPASMTSLDADIVAIDRQQLPAGWTVSDEDGRLLLYPSGMSDTNGYLYIAVVATDDQAVFDVTFSSDPTFTDPCFLPLAGFPGTVGDLTGTTIGDAVCGTTVDGNNLAVVPANDTNAESQDSALDVATALSFVGADDVPHPDLTLTEKTNEPAEVDLAGTLSGARWAVTGEKSSTRQIAVYVAGSFVGGRDVFAPSSLQTQPVVSGSIYGVPGYGAVAEGDVDGEGVSVIVTLDDGRTARLPTSPFYERSNFVVPIPDSVDVATLRFIAADGSVLAVADVPDIPLGYGGGFLNLIPRR